MSKLFSAQLVGLEDHYRDVMSNLSSIENLAKTIVKSDDYDDLPAFGMAYEIEEGFDDRAADPLNVFWELRNAYDSYYDFVVGYFKQAPRSNHTSTVSRILQIHEVFNNLVADSVCSEFDVLARLWFHQIAKNSANSFDATINEENMCYREMSNFKHLQYTAHYTIERLQKFFGYLDEHEEVSDTTEPIASLRVPEDIED